MKKQEKTEQESSSLAILNPKSDITKEWLYEQYINQKRSTTDLGREKSVSNSLISYYLKKYNIKSRGYGDHMKRDHHIHIKEKRFTYKDIDKNDLYDSYIMQNMTATDIGKALGTGHKIVLKALRYYGIPIKPINNHRTKTFDRDTLSDMVKIYGVNQTAKKLNVHRCTITKRLSEYELRQNIDENEIIKTYQSGKSIMRTAIINNIGSGCVRGILKRNNIEMRTPFDYGKNIISYPHEFELIPLLDKYNIKHITSYKLPSLPEQQKYGSRYEIDEYLPDHSIFLELYGNHWHNLKEVSIRDKRKRKLLSIHYPHIKIIVIWESQLKNGEAETIIKNIAA